MNQDLCLRNVVKLIKPKTLIWFCVSTCLGFSAIILQHLPPLKFVYLILTIVFANIGAIIVNDIADIIIDSKSEEVRKRNRPLVIGVIKIKAAYAIAFLSFILSLLISFAQGNSATIFSLVVIVFSITYLLPPTKFCARPYGSIVYWIALCICCYILMLNSLLGAKMYSNINSPTDWIFISGIILFMGIAEIIAKDLRDLKNDKEGGRNTFVNFIGVENSSRVMTFFAWFGFILWMEALYLSSVLPTLAGIICARFLLVLKSYCIAIKLTKKFDQPLAALLHCRWTYVYALMQLLTFISFINSTT